MLLGQFHRHFVQNFAVVAVERGEQRAVTVHDDEAELVIRLEKLFERLRSHTCPPCTQSHPYSRHHQTPWRYTTTPRRIINTWISAYQAWCLRPHATLSLQPPLKLFVCPSAHAPYCRRALHPPPSVPLSLCQRARLCDLCKLPASSSLRERQDAFPA